MLSATKTAIVTAVAGALCSGADALALRAVGYPNSKSEVERGGAEQTPRPRPTGIPGDQRQGAGDPQLQGLRPPTATGGYESSSTEAGRPRSRFTVSQQAASVTAPKEDQKPNVEWMEEAQAQAKNVALIREVLSNVARLLPQTVDLQLVYAAKDNLSMISECEMFLGDIGERLAAMCDTNSLNRDQLRSLMNKARESDDLFSKVLAGRGRITVKAFIVWLGNKENNTLYPLRDGGNTLEEYFERLYKYFECSPECSIISLIYIHRAIEMNPGVTFVCNKRLVLASLTLSTKYMNDSDMHAGNGYYSKVGGTTLQILNGLEQEMLKLLKFNCYVSPKDYEAYRKVVEAKPLNVDDLNSLLPPRHSLPPSTPVGAATH